MGAAPLLLGCSGVSSLSARGEDWYSGPEEKSVSIVRRGVVNAALRNEFKDFILGVEGAKEGATFGFCRAGSEGF